MDAPPLFQGPVTAAFIEIEPSAGECTRVVLRLLEHGWVELTGVSLPDGFSLPEPLGCECYVTDISDRQWAWSYEITFRSSYSRDGAFYARSAQAVQGL